MRKLFSETEVIKLVFKSEETLVAALDKLQAKQIEVLEIYSPYPIKYAGFAQSRFSQTAGRISFWSGLFGLFAGLSFAIYIHLEMGLSFGQKPLVPWISFVLPAFLGCVLFAGTGLAVAFAMYSHVMPGQQNKIYHTNATQNCFVLITDQHQDNDLIVSLQAESIENEIFIKQEIALPVPIKAELK